MRRLFIAAACAMALVLSGSVSADSRVESVCVGCNVHVGYPGLKPLSSSNASPVGTISLSKNSVIRAVIKNSGSASIPTLKVAFQSATMLISATPVGKRDPQPRSQGPAYLWTFRGVARGGSRTLTLTLGLPPSYAKSCRCSLAVGTWRGFILTAWWDDSGHSNFTRVGLKIVP